VADPPRAQLPMNASRLLATTGGRRSVFLASLPPHELDRLLEVGTIPRFDTSDPISSRPAPDDALHVLLEGAAFERSWPSDVDESFARPIAAGSPIGLTDALARPAFPRETRALTPCTTLRVAGDVLRAMIEDSPAIARAISSALVLALRSAELDRVVLSTGDAMTRVTRRIIELALTWGTATPQGGTDIDLPVTQEQLGAWAGVSRETTVKCLHWLRDRGLITTSRRHIRVRDVAELESLARRRGAAPVPRPASGVRDRLRRREH
jgi:CRP-like cAMP-binding protein